MGLLSEEHESVRTAAREFAQREIAPLAREYDDPNECAYPWGPFEQAADLGFLAPQFPEALGGGGMDFMSAVIVQEEFHRADPGVGMAVCSGNFGTEMILEFGTVSQHEKFIRPVLAGTGISGISISEPDAGSDVAAMRTTAERDGDEFILEGRKTWASNSPIAEFMVVMAKTSPGEGTEGISAIIVPTDTVGFYVEREIPKLGLRASPTAEVSLDGVQVPAENLVGQEDAGFPQLMEFFNTGRILVAASALGTAAGAFEHARTYASERAAFGRNIDEFQGLQWKLSDMATQIETARSLIYRAAAHVDQGNRPRKLASMAKYYATEICEDVCSEAIQIHGGYGYTRDFPVEKFYRDARVLKIVEGTSEIQRNLIFDNLDSRL